MSARNRSMKTNIFGVVEFALSIDDSHIILGHCTIGGWRVCPNREILMGPGCVIPSLGLWTSISPPGVPRALVGLVFDFVAK